MPETPVTEPENKPTPDGPTELREAKERAEAEAKKWRGLLMEAAFTGLELDPNKGLGKAIAKEYEGEPTAEAIAVFAETEYQWERPKVKPPEPTPEQIIQQPANQRSDQALVDSTPAMPTDIDSQIAKAEADGNWQQSMGLKAQKLAAMTG